MAPQRQAFHRRPPPSNITQRAQLIYKLFLLENARTTLEQELRRFIKKAYEEVQVFLDSSFSTSVSSDLAKALDVKCQTIEKLSASLKDQTFEPQVCVQLTSENRVRMNKPQLGHKRILMTDVLKFRPMLQNSLMSGSMAKAFNVLEATHSHQQLKHSLIPLPPAAQVDMICDVSSSYNSSVVTTSSSCHLEAKAKDIFEEECRPDAEILPPAIIASPKPNAERPPPLPLPPTTAVLPEISNFKPGDRTPLISWGREDDVQVRHQKQTSSQLLHFLRIRAKTTGALEVTVVERSENCAYASSSPQPSPPTIKSTGYQYSRGTADEPIDARLVPKTLLADAENQAPLFRVKRVESSGSLTYTCVIASKTELWDLGNIFTDVGQGSSADSSPESERCQNGTVPAAESCAYVGQEIQHTDPEHKDSTRVEIPATNSINIPEFCVRRFDETEVVISHIISPGSFYIQHADSITKLQALVTDSWKAGSSYAEQNCIPDIGTQVMGWFPKQEQWCRAQVTKICGVSGGGNKAADSAAGEISIKVEVKRLDHGDTACLSLSKIKEMTPEMANLPLQALHVSLANVQPVNGSDWSAEAADWFRAMVHNRTLYARLYPEGPKVTVELFLEKGKLGAMRRGASLSLRLAQNGHAKHNKLKNVGLVKRSAEQVRMRKQDSDWKKYLISCYIQSKK